MNPTPPPLPVSRSLRRLGQALSQARRRRHWSQQDLAERIGASVSTVRRMEAGQSGMALLPVVRALHAFGELAQFDQLLDTAQDSVGLTLMNEQLPQRVRQRIHQRKTTPESGAF